MTPLLACLTLAAPGCALEPSSEAVGTAHSPLVGGTHTTGDPAVVLIFFQNDTQIASCTGTVVSPHVVLTAAHCVHPSTIDPIVAPPYDFYVFLGDDLNSKEQIQKPGNIVTVASVHPHPMFALDDVDLAPPTADIGVVITKKALSVPPMPINRTPLDPSWIGQPVRLVGYGMAKGNDSSTSYLKREGMSPLTDIDDQYLWTGDGDTHLCGGDSGGPMLVTRNGVESVAGVHSWVQKILTCTGKATDSRVDLFTESFLDGLIAEHDPGFVPPADGSEVSAGGGGGGVGGGGVGGAGGGGSDAGGGGEGGSGAGAGKPGGGKELAEGGCSLASGAAGDVGIGGLGAGLGVLALFGARRRRTRRTT